ncbi:transposase family protein [Streptomyces syringium]|uniref:transposase family protein n=1 Tax=Streptomyces syringium TaxID=76729 RepID=UPI0033DE0D65
MYRSTITQAISEVRPLLAKHGCTITPGTRLRTLAEVIGHLGSGGRSAILDATEIRVRRPAQRTAGRGQLHLGQEQAVCGQPMVLTDAEGSLLFCGETRPGSCPDITQAGTSGLVDFLDTGPWVEILADADYQSVDGAGRHPTPPQVP